MSSWHYRVAALVCVAWFTITSVNAADPPAQLLIVQETGIAYRLGVRSGDIIESYGALASPSFVDVLKQEDAWRRVRPVRLALRRGEQRIELEMAVGERGWELAPLLPADLAARVAALLRRAAQLEPVSVEQAQELDRAIFSVCGMPAHLWWLGAMSAGWQRSANDQAAQPWLEQMDREAAGASPWARRSALNLGQLYARHGEIAAAERALARALAAAQASEPAPCAVAPLLASADLNHSRGELDRGEKDAAEALQIAESLDPQSLLTSDAIVMQSVFAWRRGQFDRYPATVAAALKIRERLVPESVDHARSINNLGDLRWALGELEPALELYRHALAIHQRLVPGGIEESRSYTNLGKAYWQAGDYLKARAMNLKALEIQRRVAPDGLDIAWSFNNLGLLARVLGDYPAARRDHFQALAIREHLFPGSPSVAYSLANLGSVLLAQGDAEGAREHYNAALAVAEKLSPVGLDTAMCLDGLSLAASIDGDFEKARSLLRRALVLRERQTPGNKPTQEAHLGLGALELALGNIDEAERHYRRADEIQQRLAPQSADVASALDGLAQVALARGDLVRAQQLAEQSEAIVNERMPGHPYLATTRYRRGQVARAQGRIAEARGLMASALKIFYRDRFDAGGFTARAYYSGQAAEAQHALIESDVADGDTGAALEALEQARARGTLEVMAEATIDWAAQLPPPLQARIDALHLERSQLNSGAPASDGSSVAMRLARLENEQEALLDDVRRAVPRFAELAYPEPLTLAAMTAVLPPGGVLVAYSLGDRESLLLALRRGANGLPETRAVRLPLDADTCAQRVDLMRGLVADPTSGDLWRAPSRALGAQLLGPLRDWLSTAKHLVVIPDGALHRLPFGVLSYDGQQPLVAQLPITVAPSMTVLAQLRARPERAAGGAWVGIGDPHYDAKEAPAKSAWLQRGGSLQPLPGTREELTRVNQLLDGARRLYLGRAATEACALGAAHDARVLHLACHGFTDDRFPLRSGLVLSTPVRSADKAEDGLLQSQEVLERMRLDADLVVLSGCDTGGGRLQGGEGLMGLSRAFLGAGARSLVASQWAISDASTATLIERFYVGLVRGLDRDVALQAAQRSFLDEAQWAHPYYWGAFQLIGAREAIPALRASQHGSWRLRSAALITAMVALVLGVVAVRHRVRSA